MSGCKTRAVNFNQLLVRYRAVQEEIALAHIIMNCIAGCDHIREGTVCICACTTAGCQRSGAGDVSPVSDAHTEKMRTMRWTSRGLQDSKRSE